MNGVAPAGSAYMDAIISVSQQSQSKALMNLFQVAKDSVEIEAKPLKSISFNSNRVDLYAWPLQ